MTECVVVYFSRSGAPMYTHEAVTLTTVANAISLVKQCRFERYDSARHDSGKLYFVPNDTLLADEASSLGIRGPDDFFGGVVPDALVKTKAITHELIDPRAERPKAWCSGFPERVCGVVLPGYTVFSAEDARRAAARILAGGLLRLKDPLGDGGKDQVVVSSAGELDALLERWPQDRLAAHGLVLECNLNEATTLSVGQTAIDGLMLSYYGWQRTVTNNEGKTVYGGSHLICARGGWDALDRLPMGREERTAVRQARCYDAATEEFPSFFVSRRNYDVCQGFDGGGQWRSGVLEASWRSGGASTAELAALTAFVQDPTLQVIEAAAIKQFGRNRDAPRDAIVHFRGDDPQDGPILRYTRVIRRLRQAA